MAGKADGWHNDAGTRQYWQRGVWRAVVWLGTGGWYWHRFGDRQGPLATEAAARAAAVLACG